MNCEEATELLEAYHDGELTAETRSALAAHLKSCAGCTATLAQLEELSGAIKSAGAFAVPENLRRNVEKLAGEAARTRTAPARRLRFGLLAASHIGVALAGGLIAYASARRADRPQVRYSGSGLRPCALVDGQPPCAGGVERHAHGTAVVCRKGRFLPGCPRLHCSGLSAVGGRVDYVGAAKVAALVYVRNKHVINVFVSPAGR